MESFLMTVQRAVHPSADVLRAFGLGKLDASSFEVVMDHLSQCEDCRKEVAALTSDDFLDRLRQAHAHSSTSTPLKTLAEAAQGPTTPFNLPPELANHPDYEVLRELGRGGMGVVYQARHRLSGRVEVLKVMNKALLGQPENKERFLREIQSAARLDHKNVVKMYTALERGELMVLVMEYVPGEDLAQVIKARGPLPVLNACYYVQQAASGLQHAFEKGMVHRDIKPQNLILAREGRKHIVKILDFGLAKATRGEDMDTELTSRGAMMGTPGYVAPEQSLDAATADIRADIYSLGCTLYHLLAGTPPFTGRSLFEILQAHHSSEARPLNLVRPEVPETLAAVVRKMMAKSAVQRYQTPIEVVRALDPFVKESLKPLPPQPVPPKLGQQDAVPPPVIQQTQIEGPATIAKGRLQPSPRKPAPSKGGQRDAGTPRVIRETRIEGRSTIAKAMKKASAKQSKKWLIVPLSVLLLVGLLSLLAVNALRVKTPEKNDQPPRGDSGSVKFDMAETVWRPAARGSVQAYVVMVGISHYADQQIKPRPHAEEDAKLLYELFSNPNYLGVDTEHSRLLLGDPSRAAGSQPATHDNILKSLHWIADNARPSDLVIFGFFGEGGPLSDTGLPCCYFAADSTFEGRRRNALATAEIGEAFQNLKSQRFCVFLDVNFNGFSATDKNVAKVILEPNPYQEFLGNDESEGAKPGRALFSANNGLAPSLDLPDHGVFADSVWKGLHGTADTDGYEPDGLVTVDELIEYLGKQMREQIRTHATTKEQRDQYFFALYGPGHHYVLTHNPAVAAKVKEQEDKFNAMVKDGKVPQMYAEEGKLVLARMPGLEAQRKLRKEYQALLHGRIDLDAFSSHRENIIESTKLARSDAVEFAEKIMEATKIIARSYVKELNTHDLVVWAIKRLYRQAGTTGTMPILFPNTIPDKIEARLKDVADMKDDELTEVLADARQALGKREDLDKHKDIDFTLKWMLYKHTDPYTTYITPEEKKKSEQELAGRFVGVGFQVRTDSVTDQLLVITPIKGSPAYRAGILAGDLITTVTRYVDNEGNLLDPPEVTPTKGLPLARVIDKITGKPGTKVLLTIQREGVYRPLQFELTREYVDVESVYGYKRKSDDNWDYLIEPGNKIAYVRLTQFAKNSYRDLQKVMQELVGTGIRGCILDLRFNPGGLLDVSVETSDLFIDDGVIVSIRERGKPETVRNGNSRGNLLDFPMVCLVNGYSASGSEIVAACLQDHDRAYIIGERSFGKGDVQHILDFDGGQLKLTTATFGRPSKKNLNKSSTSGKDEDEWGVIPNKIVKLSAKERVDLDEHLNARAVIQRKDKPAEIKPFEDKQLSEALKYLRGQIRSASRTGQK
jgi:C-terminal peptidase prc